MNKNTIYITAIILFGVLMYGLTLRGAVGNPTADTIKSYPTSAFESSHEKGPYGHVVRLATDGTYALTQQWADLASPDVGVYNGKYFTLFAPGVSYLVLPFYILGAHFNLGQVAAFSAESVVSIITLVFIYLVGVRIFTLPRWAALFASLVYGFGSTSWSYAITLYQNAFTACFLVTAFYAAWRFAQDNSRYNWLYAAYVWLAYGLAVFVDYPNALLMFPIMVYLAYATFPIEKISEGVRIGIRWSAIGTVMVFFAVVGFQFLHNAYYYDDWLKLSATLPTYVADKQLPATATSTTATTSATTTATTTLSLAMASSSATSSATSTVKSAAGFFHERKIPEGLYVLLFSDERGLFYFTPIFIFSLIGITYILRRRKEELLNYITPFALVGLNVLLYASWGDPWGGWAYGPRYLIPALPWLALFIAMGVSSGKFQLSKKIAAFTLFLYSTAIALLGALTTNLIPTKGAVALLPVKKYNYLLNIDYMQNGTSGSFIYNTFLLHHISLITYFVIIYILLVIVAGTLLFIVGKNHEK